jgi:hypothetical protein
MRHRNQLRTDLDSINRYLTRISIETPEAVRTESRTRPSDSLTRSVGHKIVPFSGPTSWCGIIEKTCTTE